MDLATVVQLIVIVGSIAGAVVKIERRITRLEMKLDRCPHVESKAPLVHSTADSI